MFIATTTLMFESPFRAQYCAPNGANAALPLRSAVRLCLTGLRNPTIGAAPPDSGVTAVPLCEHSGKAEPHRMGLAAKPKAE